MSKYAACPFCGHKKPEVWVGSFKHCYMECPKCHCSGPNAEEIPDAITAWNKRSVVKDYLMTQTQLSLEDTQPPATPEARNE